MIKYNEKINSLNSIQYTLSKNYSEFGLFIDDFVSKPKLTPADKLQLEQESKRLFHNWFCSLFTLHEQYINPRKFKSNFINDNQLINLQQKLYESFSAEVKGIEFIMKTGHLMRHYHFLEFELITLIDSNGNDKHFFGIYKNKLERKRFKSKDHPNAINFYDSQPDEIDLGSLIGKCQSGCNNFTTSLLTALTEND